MGFSIFKPDFHLDPWANEVKSVVAKLMAQENITIEYDPSAKGPSFNLQDRILTIPFWDKITESERDLQIGHETGHALYTPKEGWHNAVHELGPTFKSYLNIVEDARIEKLIKDRYPGLRRQFVEAYDSLHQTRDFFGLSKVEDISGLPFIDRINLHFKLGSRINLTFTDTRELGYISRIDQASTFEEIEEIAWELYEHDKTKALTDKDGLTYSLGKGGKLTKEELEELIKKAEQGDGLVIDMDALTSAEKEILSEILGGKTDATFQQKMSNYLSKNANKEVIDYANIPEVNCEDFLVEFPTIHEQLDRAYDKASKARGEKYYSDFKAKVTNTVGYMVKDFEMKKAAADYAKISTAKTGVLNPNKFYSYKFNDDMFRRSITVPVGKSHGLVVIIDWSGSMAPIMHETMEQLFVLTMFCKRLHIPFEIFAFTDNWPKRYDTKFNQPAPVNKDLYINPNSVRLLNLASSRMTAGQYNNALINLFTLALGFKGNVYGGPAGFSLGGTPLDETLVIMNDFIPKFQKRSKCQIANLVLLTDGDSNSLHEKWIRDARGNLVLSHIGCALNPATGSIEACNGNNYKGMVLRDMKTKTQYRGDQHMTGAILKLLQQRCFVNAFGFHIFDLEALKRYGTSYMPHGTKVTDFDKGYTIIKDQGFKEYYLTPKDNIVIQDESFKTTENGTEAIGKAFDKHLKKMLVNKLVLNKFISNIAVDYHIVK